MSIVSISFFINDFTGRSVSAAQDSGKKVLVSSGMVCFIDDSAVLALSQTDGEEKGETLKRFSTHLRDLKPRVFIMRFFVFRV